MTQSPPHLRADDEDEYREELNRLLLAQFQVCEALAVLIDVTPAPVLKGELQRQLQLQREACTLTRSWTSAIASSTHAVAAGCAIVKQTSGHDTSSKLPLQAGAAVCVSLLAMAAGQANMAMQTGSALIAVYAATAILLCAWCGFLYGPTIYGPTMLSPEGRGKWERRFVQCWQWLFASFVLLFIVDDHRRPVEENVERARQLPSLAPNVILVYGLLGAVHGALPMERADRETLLAVEVGLLTIRVFFVALATGEWAMCALGASLSCLPSIMGCALMAKWVQKDSLIDGALTKLRTV